MIAASRLTRQYAALNEFRVSSSLIGYFLEPGDMSQETEKSSGHQNMMEKGTMSRKR